MEKLHIVIVKKKRLLQIFDGAKLVKTYTVVLGFAPRGAKRLEGDGKTPEGDFYVFAKNERSRFYLLIGVSYPNAAQARRGLREQIITHEEHDAILRAIEEKKMPPQKTALGGEIYIHGGGTEHDWTKGCIALENEEMREIFETVAVGAKVRIFP